MEYIHAVFSSSIDGSDVVIWLVLSPSNYAVRAFKALRPGCNCKSGHSFGTGPCSIYLNMSKFSDQASTIEPSSLAAGLCDTWNIYVTQGSNLRLTTL